MPSAASHRCTRTIFVATGCVSLTAVAVWGLPRLFPGRPEISDPAILNTMPIGQLYESELQTLVRAAFREADAVTIESEGNHRGVPWRSEKITDRDTLGRLADSFALGRDEKQLPAYPYPGLTYTQIAFDGPYRPDISFVGPTHIYVRSTDVHARRRSVDVATDFSRAVAEAVGLRALKR